MAELHRTSGSKYVTLVSHLRISKDTLRWTLEGLMEEGWVVRNPGHRHPMRPEYLLTARGAEIARHCAPLLASLRAHDLERTGLRKWSMPALHAIGSGFRKFSTLKSVLPDITARALAMALANLQSARLVERIDIEESEAGSYVLTKSGKEFADLLAAFLRKSTVGYEISTHSRDSSVSGL